MNKIKAIFIDVDGTLRDNNKQISERTKDIIKTITKKGIYVILASGRNYTITKEISKEMSASKIIICCNGTLVVDYENDKILLEKDIDLESARKVFEYCNTHNCILTANEMNREYLVKNINDITNKCINLIIQSDNYERMLILKDYFKEKIPNVIVSNSSKNLVEKNRVPNYLYFHDISAPQTSKGNGILEVMDYLNLKEDEVMCIGDSINDISMFLVCGEKIAMGNASDELKKYSTKVIKTNEEEGVYYFLKEFVDNIN